MIFRKKTDPEKAAMAAEIRHLKASRAALHRERDQLNRFLMQAGETVEILLAKLRRQK